MKTILGQPSAVETLQRSLASGRVHHAWVFHGPVGVGKFTTARAFARILLCHQAQADLAGQLEACGSCPSCRLLDDPEAAHPDLHVVTKELALYSDNPEIRKRKLTVIPRDVLVSSLVKPAGRKSSLGHSKVFIVDEAEMIDPTKGQGTVLKTLEEPPAGTFIILVTSQEDQLLPTVRSRCQRVAFGRLDDAEVDRWVAEHHEMAPARRRVIVRMARGSLGMAEIAVEYELDRWLLSVEPMVDDLASGRAATQLGPTLAELADDFARRWVDSHTNASKEAANRMAVRQVVGMLGAMVARRLASGAAECGDAEADTAERRLAVWLDGADLLAEAERHLSNNVAMALLLQNLAIQWSAAATARA